MRSIRDLLRYRLLLVKQSTYQLLSLQSMISRHTGLRLTSHQVKHLTHNDLKQYLINAATLFAARQNLRLVHHLQQQIHDIEAYILVHCDQE